MRRIKPVPDPTNALKLTISLHKYILFTPNNIHDFSVTVFFIHYILMVIILFVITYTDDHNKFHSKN